MGVIASKFGGTSLADAFQFRKVAEIVKADARRRYVVVSAPGKRTPDDKKITDLLLLAHQLRVAGVDASTPLALVRERYLEIERNLGVKAGMVQEFDRFEAALRELPSRDWVASRGEYFSAKIMAALLGAHFKDAAELIFFGEEGRVDPRTYEIMEESIGGKKGVWVVPGFYGTSHEGEVKTFSRGGSDITGAIVARAVHAEVYENWTDVPGVLMTDPRVVPDAMPIPLLTYRELRELAYMGANVFHDEAIFPVKEAGIPIHIKNTNDPSAGGTRIVSERPSGGRAVVGIAGRKNFSLVFIEKMLMNKEIGFGRKALEVLENHGISYEHSPSGIDSMSVIVATEALQGSQQSVVDELRRVLVPDRVDVLSGIALIATVGQEMSHRVGIAARLFAALARAGVNVRIIDQGSSEMNIIVGVRDADYETSMKSLYAEFVDDPVTTTRAVRAPRGQKRAR